MLKTNRHLNAMSLNSLTLNLLRAGLVAAFATALALSLAF